MFFPLNTYDIMEAEMRCTMDLLNQIRQVTENLTPTDRRIAEAVIANPDDFARLDTASVSAQYGFSQPALTRFAKKIGYSGYAEFKYDIARNKNSMSEPDDLTTLASETGRLLEKTESMYPPEALAEIVSVLDQADRIFVTGFHRSRAAAELMNSALINYRYPSQSIPYDEVFKLDAFCRNTDLLVVFSVASSIYGPLMKSLAESEQRPATMLITNSAKHDLAKYFDHVIVLPNRKTIRSSYSLDPAVTMLFFINLLAMHLNTQK